MSLLFRSGSVPFDPTKGKTQSEVGSVAFPHDVKRAEVCLAGFDIQYDNGDHHVLRQIIDAKIENRVRNGVLSGSVPSQGFIRQYGRSVLWNSLRFGHC